ncbi:NAD(P)/FAD-dependent oxidoreductase [Zhongshania aquimaris]|uniref:NAD(P)/FAD-dependent oxidoreductase n=1 Tax=Zhongshania aquimaris TaxID=2857107 RepID=A0ABS6VV44_9GAMM|nr:NAD(P)/FAD-dependent oxidoreductase [Zhongshania aquimaris]MBW2942210.1 NAD(P)/FAD-dependent oxidoreductase [Zhongshania aquimaris]
MSSPLRHITSQGQIGKLVLKNRIIMTPMGSNTADDDGFCGDKTKNYYEARAKGGCAMIIMGSVSIAWPQGSANWRHIAISDDKYIPGLSNTVKTVHQNGCLIAAQLHHGGFMAINDSARGDAILCPSAPVGSSADELTPYMTPEELDSISAPAREPSFAVHYQEASKSDINWLINKYAEAAQRAKTCGFDGVEIHAGHGYIISSFLNPAVNRRTDEYGGSIENRSRLLIEVIRAIKEINGDDFPVWFRFDSVHFTKDGITNEDAVSTAILASSAGADAVHCSADGDHNKGTCYSEGHSTHTPAGFVPFAHNVKKAVKVPVICPGRIEPEVGDALIKDGKIDFVTMGRKLLADPELPIKIVENRMKEIRPCIYCYTCISSIFKSQHIRCAVNARTGYEGERNIIASVSHKNVLVIGGGPGGMEAARVASERGHKVTLVEKSCRLGGSVFFSGVSYPPNGKLVKYLSHQLSKLKVDVRLNTIATPELVKHLKPDVVIVAVGAARETPNVPGIDLPHVFGGDDIRNMITGENADELSGKISATTNMMLTLGSSTGITGNTELMRTMSKIWMPIGRKIVMVGGGLVAVELAEFFAERKREVTILHEGNVFASETPLVRRWRNLADIKQLGVTLIPNSTLKSIANSSLVYTNEGGQDREISADSIILTSGVVPNLSLADSLESIGFDVRLVGDCKSVDYIEGAIHSGFTTAIAL